MDQNEISSSTSTKKPNTRNKLCPDIDFPSVHTQEWKYSGHLLTWAEIIGGVRGLVSKKVSAHQACTSISKIAEDHWIQRNVYPISWQSIHKQLYKDYLEFMNVRKLINKSSYTIQTTKRYNKFLENKDFVYNISFLSSNHPAAKKRKNELEDKFKVKMGPKEFEYLESQLSNTIGRKDPKKTLCYPQKCDIDQVWEQQDNKRESLDNYYSNQRKCNEKQFEIVSFDDSFLVCDNTDDSDYEGEESEIPKKRKFKKVMETSDDPLPPKYRHVRTSE